MKKIVIINSSTRKKSTYTILRKIENLLSDFNIDFINIRDYSLKPCNGCENCLRNGECLISDDTGKLLGKMAAADGIIIGTPVYLRQISGLLKILVDRSCAWYHRPTLTGKPIFFVTATMASGSGQTMNYLKDIALQWGAIYTGHISRTMFNQDNPIEKSVLTKFQFYLEDYHKSSYRPGFKQIIEFNTQKVLAKYILPLDYSFWQERGWFGQSYFLRCRINIFKRFAGFLYYKILSFFISKNKVE